MTWVVSITGVISTTCAASMRGACPLSANRWSGSFGRASLYIVMSKDRQTVRLYSYDSRSCSLYEKRFEKGYKFMTVFREGGAEVFSVSWGDVVVLLCW